MIADRRQKLFLFVNAVTLGIFKVLHRETVLCRDVPTECCGPMFTLPLFVQHASFFFFFFLPVQWHE